MFLLMIREKSIENVFQKIEFCRRLVQNICLLRQSQKFSFLLCTYNEDSNFQKEKVIIWLRKVCSIKIIQINKVENFLKSNFDLLRLCTRFLILFHLTQMRFSQSTYLLMFLSLETLTSIISIDLPILVELTDLVNSVIICLTHYSYLK